VQLDDSFEVNLEYSSDFDKNGVFYYIGTLGGSRLYRNPHLSKEVQADWS